MIRSLRARVVLSLTAVALLVLGAFVAVVFLLFRDRLRSDLDDRLKTYSNDVVTALQSGAPLPQASIEAGQLGAAVLTEDGDLIESTLAFEGELEAEESDEGDEGAGEGGEGEGHGEGSELNESSAVATLISTATEGGTYIDVPGEHGTQLRAFVRRVDAGGSSLIVATLAPASSSGSPINRLLVICLIALGSAVLVVTIVANFVGGVAVRPLRRLAGEVHSLDERSLDDRVGVPPNATEIADVANAINTLLSRIEESLQRERSFVADASHELRNPLASLRGELELSARNADPEDMRDGIVRAIDETDRLTRLADDLLLLARADVGNLPKEPLSLADAAGTAVVHQAPKAKEVGVRLELRGEDATILGVSGLAGRAIENLIENALRYAPADSSVEVTLWSADAAAGVDVKDTGPGIKEEERVRVFDRFARADPGRARGTGGVGLGLAIVSSAMRAMDGEVQLLSAEPGDTTFRLSFSRPGRA